VTVDANRTYTTIGARWPTQESRGYAAGGLSWLNNAKA
jgi:hypothetical protein